MLIDVTEYLEKGITLEQIHDAIRKEVIYNKKTQKEKIYYDTVDEYLKTNPVILGEKVKQVYINYHYFCITIKKQPVKKIIFSKYISQELNIMSTPKTINGYSCRVYIDCIDDPTKQIKSTDIISIKCITTGKTFESVKEASDYYKVNCQGIKNCLTGKAHSAGKLIGSRKKLEWTYNY